MLAECNLVFMAFLFSTDYAVVTKKKEDTHMTCGEKIVVLRRENNLTQEQFAELMKVSRQSVSKWEMNLS